MAESIKVIQNPEAIRTAVEENRLKILNLLKGDRLSVNEIADIMNKHPSTVHRHLKKLEEHGMVEKCGARKKKYNQESSYTRSADAFIFDIPYSNKMGIEDLDLLRSEEDITEIFNLLERAGLDDTDSELIEEILEITNDTNSSFDAICEDITDNIGDLDFLTAMRLKFFIFSLKMNANPGINEELNKIFSNFNED